MYNDSSYGANKDINNNVIDTITTYDERRIFAEVSYDYHIAINNFSNTILETVDIINTATKYIMRHSAASTIDLINNNINREYLLATRSYIDNVNHRLRFLSDIATLTLERNKATRATRTVTNIMTPLIILSNIRLRNSVSAAYINNYSQMINITDINTISTREIKWLLLTISNMIITTCTITECLRNIISLTSNIYNDKEILSEALYKILDNITSALRSCRR